MFIGVGSGCVLQDRKGKSVLIKIPRSIYCRYRVNGFLLGAPTFAGNEIGVDSVARTLTVMRNIRLSRKPSSLARVVRTS